MKREASCIREGCENPPMGIRSQYCSKACISAAWRAKNPDAAKRWRAAALERNPHYHRDFRRNNPAYHHRITAAQYFDMLASQGGVCAICREEETSTRNGRRVRYAVDHDHACCPGPKSCGKCVRGLLCRKCNTLLGDARDRVDILASAISYLKDWNAKAHPKAVDHRSL